MKQNKKTSCGTSYLIHTRSTKLGKVDLRERTWLVLSDMLCTAYLYIRSVRLVEVWGSGYCQGVGLC